MKRYFIEKTFMYNGFKCVVVLQSLGHRCGYVNVKGTSLENVDYMNIDIDVHGGLTYSSSKLIEHEDGWWLGWDYAHYGDKNDYDAVMEHCCESDEEIAYINAQSLFNNGFEYGSVYSTEDVMLDCMKVVDQIINNNYLLDND